MNERGQKAKHTVERHLQALRLTRFRQIVRTIPLRSLLAPRQHLAYRAYAAMACDLLGKRGLARVVWPWQARKAAPARPPYVSAGRWRRMQQPEARRGRLSNPTAL
jgi:hypothetical protein